MGKNKGKEVVIGGLFIAIGLILPMAFHAVGGAGAIFLPMHIPVFFAGVLINPYLAATVGVITPLLSSVLTGMPPFFPIMPIMMMELATYGLITGYLVQSREMPILPSLGISMVAGRIAAGFTVWVLGSFFAPGLPGPVTFITGSIVTGIPGILIQLVFIPGVMAVLPVYPKEMGYRS